MSYFLKTHILTLVVLMLFSAKVFSAEGADVDAVKMYYSMSDFPAKLEDKSYDGALYASYRLLLSELETPINFTYAPYKRTQKLMEEETQACVFYALKTAAREQEYLFSLPLTFLSTPRLYIRGESALDEALLNDKGELRSLRAFFEARPDALMLLIDGISYGDALDEQIATLPEHNIVKRASGDRHNKLSGMFFRDRIDIALIYPQEVKQYLASHPQDNKPFQSYVVAGIPSTTNGYIMCNSNPQTQVLINDVNQAMMRLYGTSAYIQAQLRHSPTSEFALLEAAIEAKKKQTESH